MNPDANAAEWVDVVIRLVTAGGFGALVWYLVVKHIPNIEARHKKERDEWRAFIGGRDEALKEVIDEFTSEVKQSRQELAELKVEVRGYNRTG